MKVCLVSERSFFLCFFYSTKNFHRRHLTQHSKSLYMLKQILCICWHIFIIDSEFILEAPFWHFFVLSIFSFIQWNENFVLISTHKNHVSLNHAYSSYFITHLCLQLSWKFTLTVSQNWWVVLEYFFILGTELFAEEEDMCMFVQECIQRFWGKSLFSAYFLYPFVKKIFKVQNKKNFCT